jgi:quinol monooxygenase YgiN
MSTSVKIIALLKARPGKKEELKALLLSMAAPSRNEPGNLRWDVWQEQANSDQFVLDEMYVDNAAVGTHRETSHYKNYFSRIHDLAERKVYILEPVEVTPGSGNKQTLRGWSI